jgi:hypothetical protein
MITSQPLGSLQRRTSSIDTVLRIILFIIMAGTQKFSRLSLTLSIMPFIRGTLYCIIDGVMAESCIEPIKEFLAGLLERWRLETGLLCWEERVFRLCYGLVSMSDMCGGT